MAESVKHPKDGDAFDEILKNNERVVVDFSAPWCGPCKMIGPVFAEVAKEFPNIVFVGINIDDEEFEEHDLVSSISSIPLFHAYKNGEKVEELLGANVDKMRKLIENLNAA